MARTARKIDENGYLEVKGCPISSFGIFEYSAGQLGLEGDPNRIVKVYRPESAVNDPAAIDSFKNIPLINDHKMLSGFEGDDEGEAPEDKGIDGVMTSSVYYDAPWLRGDIKVFSRHMQRLIRSGKRELSLGYDCDFTLSPGVWEGQEYEVVQDNLRGNHIALVQSARVSGAKVLDGRCFDHLSFDFTTAKGESDMDKEKDKAEDSAVNELREMLPRVAELLSRYMGEEAKEEAHKDDGAVSEETVEKVEEVEAGEVRDESAETAEAHEREGEYNHEARELLGRLKDLLSRIEGHSASDQEERVEVEGKVEDRESCDDDEKGVKIEAKAEDAAISRFYADLAVKDRLYDRLSAVVGAFDCRSMDSAQVARYGVKKLGIKCADGAEAFALDAYLQGVEKGAAERKRHVAKDAAEAVCSTVETYLKEVN